jgi:hypothetical protein
METMVQVTEVALGEVVVLLVQIPSSIHILAEMAEMAGMALLLSTGKKRILLVKWVTLVKILISCYYY